MFDPYFVASLLISHPGIGAFIPRNVSTVMKEYVLKVDKDTTSQLVLLMKNQPGLLSVANDGVTVNHKSKILFTATIGNVSMFVIWIDIGSDVHVTDVEVTAGYKVCMGIKKQFGNLGISCIPVAALSLLLCSSLSLLTVIPYVAPFG